VKIFMPKKKQHGNKVLPFGIRGSGSYASLFVIGLGLTL